MKFQFITSVAAVLLSSGHGVFAAEEVSCCCWSSLRLRAQTSPAAAVALLLLLLLLVSMCFTCSSVCLSAFDVDVYVYALANTSISSIAFFHLLSSLPTNTYHSPSPKTVKRKIIAVHAQGAFLVYGLRWKVVVVPGRLKVVVKRPM